MHKLLQTMKKKKKKNEKSSNKQKFKDIDNFVIECYHNIRHIPANKKSESWNPKGFLAINNPAGRSMKKKKKAKITYVLIKMRPYSYGVQHNNDKRWLIKCNTRIISETWKPDTQ